MTVHEIGECDTTSSSISGDDVFIRFSNSFLGNKDVSEMICHLKFIFVCIFLIPQPTGNAFIWDSFFFRFVLQFSGFFRIRTR